MNKQVCRPIKTKIAEKALISTKRYRAMYQQSINQPKQFWAEQAEKFLDWSKPWDEVMQYDYPKGHIRWFDGGQLNVSYNCLDRHLKKRAKQTAIIWEGDDPKQNKHISYLDLHQQVCKFANVLKTLGISKGDRVCIYLPMIVEAATVMLACTRIGAVHVVVFGGFSAEALRDRIIDCDCQYLVCADQGVRGGKIYPSKINADQAVADNTRIKHIIVIKNTYSPVAWQDGRDICYHEAMKFASNECPPEAMNAEDPLFILYTSGSTGKPKGVLHTTGGYLLFVAITHRYVFDCQEGDIYWCTADIGWITGHSYIIYGPLCNGTTTLMFEGIPTYPEPDRCWQIVGKHKVNIFYTAPTVIRALMAQGDNFVKHTDRNSLRILGSVGEPINPEAWEWYYHVVGDSRCPIVDTWWQTETGGIMITPLPTTTALKPGSATLPFFGIKPEIIDSNGKIQHGEASGMLVFSHAWPGQARTLYGDHKRFIDTYFKNYLGYYFTGDGVHRDLDGYYWITGRIDDVINVSGHRMGTTEIESALILHQHVAEAAVVGFPHNIKGQGIYAYVNVNVGVETNASLRSELIALVAHEIGSIAKPDIIQWTNGLPKTRSGKIMRRILRKIAANELENLGDTSTLADPSVVKNIIDNRIKL